jgi:hypothetical protein
LASASTVSPVQQESEESPMISQALENSPKLTTLEKQPEGIHELTTEKMNKLKTQWLNQLP